MGRGQGQQSPSVQTRRESSPSAAPYEGQIHKAVTAALANGVGYMNMESGTPHAIGAPVRQLQKSVATVLFRALTAGRAVKLPPGVKARDFSFSIEADAGAGQRVAVRYKPLKP